MSDDEMFMIGEFSESDREDAFDDDFGVGDDDMDFEAEIGAHDRAHGGLLGAGGGSPMEKGLLMSVRDAKESFQIQADAIARGLNGMPSISLPQADIDVLITKTDFIMDVEQKNPMCYVLGYLVSKGGRELSKSMFRFIVHDVLPTLDDDIPATAVLRYARLWVKLLH